MGKQRLEGAGPVSEVVPGGSSGGSPAHPAPVDSEARDAEGREGPGREEPLHGGDITGVGADFAVQEARADKEIARKLAVLLTWLLAVSVLLHYVGTAIVLSSKLDNGKELAESLSKIFSAWLPVISGFVGSAVTYYFTRDR